ncbi:unnamed protein product [Schistosoma curassoni]|uniref:Nucleotid_trans domain-containing protein n=1 Tax=Schistosoma curassoni TaxID=6186 RepID=A0A183KWW0_9TREM|nr:unnamed protein product [Schistosoma curassoni]
MLELIRTKGFSAIKLDTDYVFFPPAADLQINEITDMVENDHYHSIDKHINIDDNNDNNSNDICYPMSSSTIGISSNQPIQNTCWCTSNPTQYSLYHKPGHNSFLSTSQIAINPNVQMNYSPYTMVDERCWLNKSIS